MGANDLEIRDDKGRTLVYKDRWRLQNKILFKNVNFRFAVIKLLKTVQYGQSMYEGVRIFVVNEFELPFFDYSLYKSSYI
jgi:hypothetical protein